MAQAQQLRIAIEDFIAIDRPVEIVNGEIVEMAPTQFKHDRIAHDLYDSIRDYLNDQPVGRVLMEVAYVLSGSEDQQWVRGARVPDVSFITQDRYTAYFETQDESGPLWLAPDLAVEIVSPNDTYIELDEKIAEYLEHGVQLVWVIDPALEKIRVHSQDAPQGHTLHAIDVLTGDPVLPGWSLPVAALFAGPV